MIPNSCPSKRSMNAAARPWMPLPAVGLAARDVGALFGDREGPLRLDTGAKGAYALGSHRATAV